MRKQLLRRNFLRRLVFAYTAGILGSTVIGRATLASTTTGEGSAMSIRQLAGALMATGKPTCIREAKRLEALPPATTGFDLHLRRADLHLEDAEFLADAIQQFAQQSQVLIRSFSVSYNPELKDAGVITLINSFPSSLTEVGLVGCDFGDAGAGALLEWAHGATKLQMICIETDSLSTEMHQRYRALRNQRSNVLVIT